MFPVGMNFVDCEFLSPQEKLRPVLLLLLGLAAVGGLLLAPRGGPLGIPTAILRRVYTFFNRRQFYDKIINDLVSLPLFRFGFGVTTSLIDKGMIEVLVPVGLTNSRSRVGAFNVCKCTLRAFVTCWQALRPNSGKYWLLEELMEWRLRRMPQLATLAAACCRVAADYGRNELNTAAKKFGKAARGLWPPAAAKYGFPAARSALVPWQQH